MNQNENGLLKNTTLILPISKMFLDAFSIDFIDEEHSSKNEIRYGVIGKTAAYGLVILIYSVSGDYIRFITARRAE
jgi:uncharacterized DUF497 family protein